MKISLLFILLPLTILSQNPDINLLYDINKNGNPESDKNFEFITQTVTPLSIGVPIGVFITGLATKKEETKQKSYLIGATVLSTCIVATTLKHTVKRERPFEKYPFIIKKTEAG